MRILVAVLTACLLAAPLSAPAAPAAPAKLTNVNDIVVKMKNTTEPTKGLRKVIITTKTDGESIQWSAAQASSATADGKRMLLVLLDPPDLKGTAVLVAEAKERPAPMWVYVPMIRRVRKLVGPDAYEHFLGTDFTFADLGFVRLTSKYKLLGEEDKAGRPAYKIEETRPQDQFAYSRIIVWVAQDTYVPLQRDYYDVAGNLWKTETIESTVVDGVPTALHVVMKDVQSNETTELEISAVHYSEKVPDALFDPTQLRDASTSPVWSAVGVPGGTNK
jgi:hypothetical protein